MHNHPVSGERGGCKAGTAVLEVCSQRRGLILLLLIESIKSWIHLTGISDELLYRCADIFQHMS